MSTLPIVNAFLTYLTDERHFSPYTARCYGADLRQFVEYLLDETGFSLNQDHEQAVYDQLSGRAGAGDVAGKILPDTLTQTVREADTELLRAYLAHLSDQNYSPATMARKIATLRSFYKWALKRGLVETNPMTLIRTPRQSKRLPRAITVEQIERLLSAPDDTDVLGARDRAMLETLYSTGIRVSELVDLDYDDLDETGEALRVRGKGKKERLVPLGSHALAAIRHYREVLASDERFAEAWAAAGPAGRPPLRQQARRAPLLALRAPQARQVPAPGRARPLHQPAHAAPLVRDAPARQRRRPPLRPGAARPPVAQHDADVHPPSRRSACARPTTPRTRGPRRADGPDTPGDRDGSRPRPRRERAPARAQDGTPSSSCGPSSSSKSARWNERPRRQRLDDFQNLTNE